MKKKSKLKLEALKIKSFITTTQAGKIIGGASAKGADEDCTYTRFGNCSKRWCGSSHEQTVNCTEMGSVCSTC